MPKTPVICGRRVTVIGDPRDSYFENVPDDGPVNDSLLHIIGAVIPPDGVAFDVGANIGVHALALSTLAPRGHVHVFEPSPVNLGYLRRNLDDNAVTNATVHATAVGAEPGTLTFWHNTEFAAGSVALDGSDELFADYMKDLTSAGSGSDERSQVVEVPCTTLDDFVAAHPLDRIDLVKIDTEGWDLRVLQGARKVLAEQRPMVITEFATYALTMHQRTLPVDALRQVREMFDHVHVVLQEAPWVSEIVTDQDAVDFLHQNATERPVQDLLCCFEEHADVVERLRRSRAVAGGGTAPNLASATATAAAPAGRAEDLQRELDAMRQTLSWKVTAPLRSARRALDRRRAQR